MEKETALPKNVRQIGDIQGNKRIYMEDYVVTYIHKKEKQEEKEGFLGVFLGEMQKSEGETRLFIRGLMNIPLDRWDEKPEDEAGGQEAEKKGQNLNKAGKEENGSGKKTAKDTGADRDAESWEMEGDWEITKSEEGGKAENENKRDAAAAVKPEGNNASDGQKKKRRKRTVQEECRDYFGDLEILGCCVVGRYQVEPMKKLIEEVPQSRRLLYHLQEQEERLYWTETGKYEEISGYFVFYEQNRKMQEYMTESFSEKEEEKEKITDQAIKAFREKIKKKDQMQTAGMMKLASSFFVAAVLIVGAIVVTRVGSIRDSSGSDSGLIKTSVQDNGSVYGTGAAAGENKAVNEDTAAVAGSTVLEDDSGAAASVSETADSESAAVVSGAADSGAVAPVSETADSGAAAAVSEALDSGAAASVSETADSGAAASVSGALDSGAAAAVSETADSGAAAAVSEALDSAAAALASGAADNAAGGLENGASDSTVSASLEDGGDDAAAAEDPAVQEDVEASAAVRQVQASYVIREGDTLADICQRYYGNLNKLEELCQENGIENADKIMPGQKIVLP